MSLSRSRRGVRTPLPAPTKMFLDTLQMRIIYPQFPSPVSFLQGDISKMTTHVHASGFCVFFVRSVQPQSVFGESPSLLFASFWIKSSWFFCLVFFFSSPRAAPLAAKIISPGEQKNMWNYLKCVEILEQQKQSGVLWENAFQHHGQVDARHT